jgi:hypothetical protein
VGRREHQDLLGARWFAVLHGIGRLRRGVTLSEGEADLSGLIRRDTLKDGRVLASPLVDDYFGRLRWALLVALASAFLLLAIACSNVAGLLLARTARRRQEWAIRRAIGGTTSDVVRLSAVETTFIALSASASGVAAAPGLVRLIAALDPTALLAGYPILVDARVLAVTVRSGRLDGHQPGDADAAVRCESDRRRRPDRRSPAARMRCAGGGICSDAARDPSRPHRRATGRVGIRVPRHENNSVRN